MRFLRVFLSLAIGFVATVGVAPLVAKQPVPARHGMVVAMESIAADVGVEVLKTEAMPSMPPWRWGLPCPRHILMPATSEAGATC